MQRVFPTVAHDLLGAETRVVEEAAIAILNRPIWSRAPKHLRYGFGDLNEVGFTRSQCRFGTLLIVNIGRRTDEFEDVSFHVAQDHGLLEVPAICPSPSSERPGFEREVLPRMHTVPKSLDRRLPILGM